MNTATPFPRLLSPGRLGRHETKNRVWMTSHATLLVKDHLFTDAHVDYYVERAKGGVAVITMEAMAVHETTQPYPGKAFAFDPRMVPQFRKIAAAVHNHGTKILAQPWHRGRQTHSVTSKVPVWAPSAIPCSVYREMPKVMTLEDIEEIVEGYRLTARHAIEGDLDGIEIAATSHGYLLNQFLSPATNHRTDEYGGSLENRMRIVMRIVDATRAEAGPDAIVGIRINSDDGMAGGLGPVEWAEIARRLEATGKLDYISCTHGTYLNRMLIYATSPEEHGYQMKATRQVKEAVGLPIVGVGRITTPDEAEGFLRAGDCDFIGMTRQLIADPFWVRKASSGESEKIRPCVGANWCMESIFAHAPIACIHNPTVGRERTLSEESIEPAQKQLSVAVVGGGPAGMRAALTASRRGHRVTLIEKGDELGGQVRWIGRAQSGRELADTARWLAAQLRDSPVQIYLKSEATVELLSEGGFDAIVVATGATGMRDGWSVLHPAKWDGPPMPGSDQDWVWSYTDALGDPEPLKTGAGRQAVIFDGIGARQAVHTAEYLARHGWQVEVVTQLGQGVPNLAASRDWGKAYGMLRRLGVRFTTDHEIQSIGERELTLVDVYTRETQTRSGLGALIYVNGARANDALYHDLRERLPGLPVHLIGDAVAPRRINDAIYEGELLARKL
jgi:2,4-dienoyl-CoA reductase-like NADH-dependent reductase (Old Yellow Enzyme family)/threonine dehydrogenase-like Zn-dependent dehydrogenase